jgi:hypothetical protein
MSRHAIAVVLAVLVCAQSQPAQAYLKFGVAVGDKSVALKWAPGPVRYYIFDSSVPGVSSSDLQSAVGSAFATWQAVPTSSIAYQFAGVTSAPPGQDDGLSAIGFESHPEFDGVLASTDFVVDDATGQLIESDIFFNSAFKWSVSASGEAGKYDLQSIALHETGHFGGLAHSALGETSINAQGQRSVLGAEAVMFPIAFASGSVAARTLRADDIAGISDLYPDGDFTAADGSVSGRVLKSGQPLFGAHVVAFDPRTNTMVGAFTLNAQGQFSIAGLSPGPHIIRVEPLDDASVDSFFDQSVTPVDVNFQVMFDSALVVVPRGGDSGQVTLTVLSK